MASNGNKRVLVTGASGMIGRQICAELQSKSYGVLRAQVRDRIQARAQVGDVFDFTMADVRQADFTMTLEHDLRKLTGGCHTVVHAAGLVHQPDAQYQEYEVINVRATQGLVEAAVASKVDTFVFLSTSAVYGPGPFKNIEESAPTMAKTPYAVSKLTSERFLEEISGLRRVIVLRPSLVFGEGDRGNLIKMIREIKNQRYKHIGSAATGKSIIYTKDLARALHLCLEKTPAGFHVFNVANPEPVSIRELADSIASCLELTKKIPTVNESLLKIGVKAAEMLMPGKAPISAEQVEKLTTETTCSIDKLVTQTGFQPMTQLAQALKAEIDWAGQNKLL